MLGFSAAFCVKPQEGRGRNWKVMQMKGIDCDICKIPTLGPNNGSHWVKYPHFRFQYNLVSSTLTVKFTMEKMKKTISLLQVINTLILPTVSVQHQSQAAHVKCVSHVNLQSVLKLKIPRCGGNIWNNSYKTLCSLDCHFICHMH